MLTEKQKRFCENYVVDFNATQAAIRVGYSKKTANEQAARLLAKVSVKNYVSELKGQLSETVQVTKEQLVSELKKVAFFDIRNIYNIDGALKNVKDFGDDEAAAIAGVDTYDTVEPGSGMILGKTQKVKLQNKIQAIERICKMLGYDAPVKQELKHHVEQPLFD